MVNKRYHTFSDFNYMWEDSQKYIKAGLLYLFLRELPLKNFYARCFVVGASLWYANYHWFRFHDKAYKYAAARDEKEMNNYPRLRELVTKRIDSKTNSPTILESDHWYQFTTPTFYHHHFKHYRYLHRTRREVNWDGTYNMPTMPFMSLNDRTGFVHAGLLEAAEPKGNAAW